jgi:hypothetical protein
VSKTHCLLHDTAGYSAANHNNKKPTSLLPGTYKRHRSNEHDPHYILHSLATTLVAHLNRMDSEEAYDALLKLILADEPSRQDGKTWDQINLSFTVVSPHQKTHRYVGRGCCQ